ncbi:MAG: helix-turn-helix domain-containing protein [Candidatus Paceibacterota bacterium]|jgi:hypothetical protein
MKLKEKEQAIRLRRQGKTFNEIVARLGVAKSSVSLWVKDLDLPPKAQERIASLQTAGQKAARKSKMAKTQQNLLRIRNESIDIIEKMNFDKYTALVTCSLLYWCEGAKTLNDKTFTFTNSDPVLVQAFLKLMRTAFELDERKFRVRMHLHEYHNENVQKRFWSVITEIPQSQFRQTYWKPHTGKNTKEGYPGCIHVMYYDVYVSRKVCAVARAFLENVIK